MTVYKNFTVDVLQSCFGGLIQWKLGKLTIYLLLTIFLITVLIRFEALTIYVAIKQYCSKNLKSYNYVENNKSIKNFNYH